VKRASTIVAATCLLAAGCGYFEAKRQREELDRREAGRVKALDEWFQNFGGLGWQERAGRIHDLLNRTTEKTPRGVAEWNTYRERLAKCAELIDHLTAAAAQKRHRDLTSLAVEGFATSAEWGFHASARAKERFERASKAELQGALQLSDEADLYQAVGQLLLHVMGRFLETLGFIAQNAPPADRLETFRAAASTYMTLNPNGPRARLGKFLSQVCGQEDDPDNQAKMELMLQQLNLPVRLEEPETKAVKK